MKAILWAAALALAALGAGQAQAQDAPAIKALGDCTTIADVGQKAACYDTAMAALNKAIKSGEIVVVQRKEAQAAQRGAFGFNLPSLSIFDRLGGGKDDDKAAKAERKAEAGKADKAPMKAEDGAVRDETGVLQAITTTLKRASRDATDKWVFELSDGAVWRQIDNEVIAPSPKAGATVEIRRAAFGSYVLEVNGGRPVRVRRSE